MTDKELIDNLQSLANSKQAISKLQVNHVYIIEYQCRDIGYGVEEGAGEFVYRGLFDSWGKHEWQPLDGSETLYLFPDEVISAT